MARLYPQQPTDHVTALKQYYAEDEEKRRRFGEQLAEQGRQRVKKAESESLANTFQGLASFSKTVSSGLATVEARKTKADTKYQKEISDMLSMNPVLTKKLTDYIVDKSDDYKGERKNIFKDSKFLDPVIKNLSAKDKEALQALLKHDPRRMIILQETLARRFATQLPGRAEGHEATLKKDGKWFKKDADNNDIPLTKEEHLQKIKDFKAAELAKFGISTEAIAAIASGELRRQNETLRGTKTSVIDSELFRSNRALQQEIFKTSAGSIEPKALGDNIEKIILERAKIDFKDIKDGQGNIVTSAIQQATESVVTDIIKLADAGFVPNGALAGLEDYEFEHPAGKNGKASVIDAFFAKDGDHFNRMVNAVDRGQSKILGTQTNLDTVRLSELKAKASQVGLNKEETAELDRIANRGLLPDQSITDVRDISVDANTPEAYKIVEQSYKDRGILSGGNLIAHEAEIKLEENDDFRNKQLDRIQHHKERRRELGYPKNDEKFVRDRIAKAFNLTLGDDEDLSGKLYDLQVHLVQKLRKEFQNQIEDPNGEPIIDRHSWTLTNDAFEQYVVNKGIDIPASTDPNNPNKGEGIFSATGEGKMNNFKLFQDERISAIKENRSRLNDTNIALYDKNLNTAYKNAKNNKNVVGETVRDRVLNTAESVLTKEDILGFFSEGLSGEILLKARRMGIPPSTLVKRQYEALKLVNKDYLTRHGIDNVEFDQPDETIHDILKNNDKTLAYVFANTTPSPKQTARIIAAVEKVNKKNTIYKQDAAKTASVAEPQQEPVTQPPTAEARLNFKEEFPQYMHLSEEELNQKIVEVLQVLKSN